MPSWGEILNELSAGLSAGAPLTFFDETRDKYLNNLVTLTSRPVVVYASDFLGKGGQGTAIRLSDMQGLMEVFKDVPGPNLDLILHSPGGEAEATERLVRYMRSKFSHIRIFIPLAAMSAATMWTMAADEIVMGKHSQLGPIDPQISLNGGPNIPAGALIEQFEEANKQCAEDPKRITGWLPTLQQYPPGILNVCESATLLSKQLVKQWLETYIFKADPAKVQKSTDISNWLADDHVHLSHSRPITREDLREKGLPITNLEEDSRLQDAVLSVHHCLMHTFAMTSAVKIVENNLKNRWIQHGGFQTVSVGPAPTPTSALLP